MRINRYQSTGWIAESRLERYFRNIQQDLKLFLFLLLLLCFYRAFFMWKLSGFMGSGVTAGDILQANWTGLRLSLKGAGGFTLLAFLLVTVANLIRPRWQLGRIRLIIGTIASFILAVLFEARFPYYEEFHMTYGLQVMQGAHDDKTALFFTMVQEYGLPWRLALAVLLTILCWAVLKRLLAAGTRSLPMRISGGRRLIAGIGLTVLTVAFMFFARFGGGFNYATGINWENAGTTGDEFLNECILDDVQGIYRAIQSEKMMKAGNIYGVDKQAAEEMTPESVRAEIARTAPGAKIARPKHIFIIMGETWAQWPMLEQYAGLHVADGIKGLAAEPNAYYTRSFMPNGDFTSIALTGMITGLSEVNIRANYQPKSFKTVYPTAIRWTSGMAARRPGIISSGWRWPRGSIISMAIRISMRRRPTAGARMIRTCLRL